MTRSSTLQHYARHDPLTHPADWATIYDELPAGIGPLCDVLSGLIVHTSWADKYGIPAGMPLPRDTKPVGERLREIKQKFDGPLGVHRAPILRAFGTCRDYALMLCSALRHRGIPARVRCGFATYFASRRYADHWICEYWIDSEHRWGTADAQIDPLQRSQLAIAFDTADMPANAFLPAPLAWQRVRAGVAPADDFGHAGTGGLWFLSVNLRRDLLALSNRHRSAWDTWRTADEAARHLDERQLAACDRLAEAVIAAEVSGDIQAFEDLAGANMFPPWQQAADLDNRAR